MWAVVSRPSAPGCGRCPGARIATLCQYLQTDSQIPVTEALNSARIAQDARLVAACGNGQFGRQGTSKPRTPLSNRASASRGETGIPAAEGLAGWQESWAGRLPSSGDNSHPREASPGSLGRPHGDRRTTGRSRTSRGRALRANRQPALRMAMTDGATASGPDGHKTEGVTWSTGQIRRIPKGAERPPSLPFWHAAAWSPRC